MEIYQLSYLHFVNINLNMDINHIRDVTKTQLLQRKDLLTSSTFVAFCEFGEQYANDEISDNITLYHIHTVLQYHIITRECCKQTIVFNSLRPGDAHIQQWVEKW